MIVWVSAAKLPSSLRRSSAISGRKREEFAQKLATVEARLTEIESEGAVIKKHCHATPEETQTAIREYKKRRHDAEALVLGMEFIQRERLKKAKAKLRRLSARPRRQQQDAHQ